MNPTPGKEICVLSGKIIMVLTKFMEGWHPHVNSSIANFQEFIWSECNFEIN